MILGRFEDITEAKQLVIELYPNKWMNRHVSDYGEEAFLKSVARRAKEYLMWKLVAEEHIDEFPKEIVWGGENLVSSPTHFRVVATEPKGELQVTPTTQVICRIKK